MTFIAEPTPKFINLRGHFNPYNGADFLAETDSYRHRKQILGRLPCLSSVAVAGDPDKVYFDIADLDTIVKANPTYVGLKFGCKKNGSTFKDFCLIMSATDADGILIGNAFVSHTQTSTPHQHPASDLISWASQRMNTIMNCIDVQLPSSVIKDHIGYVYETKKVRDWLDAVLKQPPNRRPDRVAVYFGVKGKRTNIIVAESKAFVDKVPTHSNPNQYVVYDNGMQCCPVQRTPLINRLLQWLGRLLFQFFGKK